MATRSENMVIIIGNLTRDPELRYTPQGHAVVSFGVATNREWTTAEGEKKEDTQFHEVVAWNRLAEICKEFLVKGRKVYVKGRLQTRTWDDENKVRHYRTEIVSDDMIILDSRRGTTVVPVGSAGVVPAKESAAVEEKEKGGGEEVNPDSMPF